MKFFILKFIIFTLILILQGCSTKTISDIDYSKNNKLSNNLDYNEIYNNLLTQYKDWKGVKYRYGGYSKNGIDCSAFVQKTYKDKLFVNIPRTTILQKELGKEVDIDNLATGDLIFFKTGFKTNHVGIYLKNGKFMHVSTKKGVIISRLDNPYYSKHLWKIKRVLH
ncbi:NlpC/P60 family protein [Halarcobacter sp.]|uniref:NlpC/P60 family protein n=1 Tax=Halarcobacter sp. TaxID=2321133 RepID=UPI0029F501F7|nr:NlpC/P60 family protein [Halarcobacter sp.]